VVGGHDDHAGHLTAVDVGRLNDRFQQGFGERTARTSGGGGGRSARGPGSGRTTSTVGGVGVVLHTQATRLASHRSGRSHSRVLGHDHGLNVALQLQHGFGLDVGHFRTTTSLLHQVGTAGDTGLLGENLHVVAHTLGGGLGVQRHIVAVDLGVVGVGGCQGVTLPLVERVGRGHTANGTQHRGLGRAGVVDFVGQVLAVTLEGSLLVQVGWHSHFNTPSIST